MKPRKNKARRNLCSLISLLVIAFPMGANAVDEQVHVVLIVGNPMTPEQLGQVLLNDPASVVWNGPGLLRDQPLSVVHEASTAEVEAVELPAQILAGQVAAAATAATENVANAIVRFAEYGGTYKLSWGGAQRDITSSFIAAGKAAIVAGPILAKSPYTTTREGTLVTSISAAAIGAMGDVPRYLAQELVKGILINRLRMQENAAAWTAFATSQGFSIGATALWAYSVNLGLAQYFTKDTDSRRNLLQTVQGDVNYFVNTDASERQLHFGCQMARQNGDFDTARKLCSAEADATFNLIAAQNNYNNHRNLLSDYISTKLPDLGSDTAQQITTQAVDPYPGFKDLVYAGSPDYDGAIKAVADTFYSKCRFGNGGGVSVTCPISRGGYWQATISLNPKNINSDGTVTLYRTITNGSGKSYWADPTVVDPKRFGMQQYM
ncbi:hypothetical protein [Ralstonia wenshanensis]|uniref:hypothetical protein n=1 Tax=Ralstonia wenshanensis TaxID=2842456 RepID=UPI002AAEE5AD|nr:hypothetical protein [Ralstonia wenshanensis]MDY7507264.1 hypothetical protein [Ralstonia wenshanensis]